MKVVKYSHTGKYKIRHVKLDEGSYLMDYGYIFLFFAAIITGVTATTMYQTTDPEIVDIAVYQMISGIAGLLIGFIVLMRRDSTSEDTTVGNLKIGFPNQEDVISMLTYIMVGFIVSEFATILLVGVPLSSFVPNMQIAITAAVMEEALFGFAGTTLAGTVFYYIIRRGMGVSIYDKSQIAKIVLLIAQIAASAFMGVFFVALHIGVYGTSNETLLLQLFVARAVYSFVYLRTRNILVPTAVHLAHNLLVFV